MKPRSLMDTLYGDYIEYYGGEIWMGSLIQFMAKFGISESSTRGATLRMVQQNLLQVRKVGNKSYYSLTHAARKRVIDGIKRVYLMNHPKWDGFWRIMTYSIPEEKRDLRNQIRKELTWIGFGPISNSTWVSPNPIEEQVMDIIESYKLEEYTMLLSSSSVVSHHHSDVIKKGWDLGEIRREYDSFIEHHQEKYKTLKEKAWNKTLSDEECFLERVKLVHDYRKLLFKDPRLPLDLLPVDWNGTKARELFWNIHQLISVSTVRYFESVFEQAPDKNGQPNREKAIHPYVDIY